MLFAIKSNKKSKQMKNTCLNIETQMSKYAYRFVSETTQTSSSADLGVSILVSLDIRKHVAVYKKKYLSKTQFLDGFLKQQ